MTGWWFSLLLYVLGCYVMDSFVTNRQEVKYLKGQEPFYKYGMTRGFAVAIWPLAALVNWVKHVGWGDGTSP